MTRVPVRVIMRGIVPLRMAAWVPLPRLIIFRSAGYAENEALMAHELMHVLQAEAHGWRWPLAYVWQWARTGFSYTNMPFEVEARAAEKDPEMLSWASEVIRRE